MTVAELADPASLVTLTTASDDAVSFAAELTINSLPRSCSCRCCKVAQQTSKYNSKTTADRPVLTDNTCHLTF